MKGMKIIIPVMVINLCVMLFFKSGEFYGPKVSIENPENISQIQLRTFKISREDYPSKKLDNLLKCIEATVPVKPEKDKGLERNEEFTSVLLIYEDGTKEKFFFFENDGKWYMETEQGILYENAEFIKDYGAPQKIQESHPPVLTVNPEILEIYLTLLKENETADKEFEILYHVAAYEKAGASEKEAFQKAEQILEERQKLFEYAKKSGFFPSEDEQTEIIEKYILTVKEADGYDEFEALCNQSQFSAEDILWTMKDSILEIEISNRFCHERELEFMEGNDTVNGQVCGDIRDYCQRFLQENVYGK